MNGSGPNSFVLELPSDLRMIEAAVGYLVARCRSISFEGPKLDLNFRVAVTEALANAILYGNAGQREKLVRVEVSLDPHRIVICVADEGRGFDPDNVPDPTRPENVGEAGGRGIYLIRKLMDETQFNEQGNAVRMVLRQDSPSGRLAGSKR